MTTYMQCDPNVTPFQGVFDKALNKPAHSGCGWKGKPSELDSSSSGVNVCPNCGYWQALKELKECKPPTEKPMTDGKLTPCKHKVLVEGSGCFSVDYTCEACGKSFPFERIPFFLSLRIKLGLGEGQGSKAR